MVWGRVLVLLQGKKGKAISILIIKKISIICAKITKIDI